MQNTSTHTLTWTVVPRALLDNGAPLVAVHCSPRLAAPPPGLPAVLASYDNFVDWPSTVLQAATLSFRLTVYDLETDTVLAGPIDTDIVSRPRSDLWRWLFPGDTPVVPRAAATGATRDQRLDRKYSSYSVRSFAERIRRSYVALANASYQNLQRISAEEVTGEYRARVAAIRAAPVQRPTIAEVSGLLGSLNLQLPQTPAEHDKLCLQRRRAAFQAWVDNGGVGGQPSPEIRREANQRLDAYLRILRPLPDGATEDPASFFKPDAYRLMVERVMVELQIAQSQWAPRPSCEGGGVPTALRPFVTAAMLPDQAQLDHALFHRVLTEATAGLTADTHRLDFHELVSTLSSHPVLYPHLGVVFDVRGRSPIPDPMRWPKARIAVEAVWQRPPVQTITSRYPRTAYQVFPQRTGRGALFVACSRSEGSTAARAARDSNEDRVHQGVLDVSDPQRFYLEIMDTHGDYFKMNSADQNGPPSSPDAAEPRREKAVAKLRSCGIALVRANRKDKVEATARNNDRLQRELEQGTTTFYAEDLTLGYRVDVNTVGNTTRTWKSLCRRTSEYDFWPRAGTPPIWQAGKEDGIRVEGIVNSGAAKPADGMDHQLLETMFRWENWSLAAPVPLKSPPPQPEYPSDMMPLRLRATHRAVDLPQMQYGRSYYLRCRAAFIDGSGLLLEECDDSLPKVGNDRGGPFTFTRVESVDTPVVLLANPIDASNPGEHAAHVVIREGRGASRRYVVPPRVSPYQAQLHGMIDQRREGAFKRYLWHSDGTFASVREYLGIPAPAGRADRRDPSEQNAIFTPARKPVALKFPYYPDPAAQGARVTLLYRRAPAGKALTQVFEFFDRGDEWPHARALQVELVDADAHAPEDAALHWEDGKKTLQVQLKKGRTAAIVLSPMLADATAKDFMFEALLSEELSNRGVDLPDMQLHWLFISQTELQLVNAVEKPRIAPSLETLVAGTPVLGSNSFPITGRVFVDPDSTGELHVVASWSDPVDDGLQCANGKTSTASTRVPAHEKRIELTAFAVSNEERVNIDFEHAIGDTKFHAVTYSVSGTSRFAPYFKSATKPGQPDTSGRFTSSDGAKDRLLYVCNRGVPDTFRVLYAIPAFKWTSEPVPRHITMHHRHGGGVRLYLDATWWSSGAGELLAVLLREGMGSVPEAAAALVTQWGSDPVFKGPAITNGPRAEDFEGRKMFPRYWPQLPPADHLVGLPVQEHPGVTVTAVAFEPQFNCERKLWYCDLVLNPQNTYYPFVRFALARLQPNSVDGAHLSKVVTADVVQLAPDRWVQVTWEKHVADVVVYGHTFAETYGAAEASTMVVRVEDRLAHADPDLCWIPTIDPQTHGEIVTVVRPTVIGPGHPMLGSHKKYGVESGMALWHTSFDLGHVPFGVHRRILVQEVETLPADKRQLSDSGMCERVVFADAIEL